jgi:HK97 family phage major capsid protein
MDKLQKLKVDRMHLVRSAQDILDKAERENREMTPDEKKESDAMLLDVDNIEKQIADIEDHNRRAEIIRARAQKLEEPEQRRTTAGQPGHETPPAGQVTLGYRVGKTKAFPNTREGHEAAYRSGQFIRAALFNDVRAQRWCVQNGIEVRALTEGSNTAGGFLVPDEMSQTIIDLREQYGTFRQWARVVPMGRDVMPVTRRAGGVTAAFVGEGGSFSESDKSWNQVNLSAKKLGVLSLMSSELNEDAVINLADDISDEFAYAFALKEDQCGWLGDGTATYGGITGVCVKAIDGTHNAGKVAAATPHNTFAELDAADLTSLMGKCPAYARLGAAWYCSQLAYDVVFSRLAATAGGNTVQTISGAFAPSYLGYPIRVSQVLESGTGDLNADWMLGFGNLAQAATFGDRRGFAFAVSNERYFETDQIGLKASERIDIVVHDLGDNTNAGPLVSLVGTT